MKKIFHIGDEIYITGLLPFNIIPLISKNIKYSIAGIDYYKPFPIKIHTNSLVIYLTIENIKLASLSDL